MFNHRFTSMTKEYIKNIFLICGFATNGGFFIDVLVDDVVAKGFPKEINEWEQSQVEIYKDLVFEFDQDKSPDTTEAEEILGAKVTYTGPPTDENKVCPNCTDKGSVVDNRDKKSDPKFSKIPDFACQKAPYGSGCGWAAWSGNESIPSEWI